MQRAVTAGAWWLSPTAGAVASLVPTVLAIFIGIHELTLHGVLHQVVVPGESQNIGSAIALARGQLPYSNFALTSPPGMSVLLLPFALLLHGGGTSGLASFSRSLTELAAVLCVFFAGLSARSYGVPASLLAGVFTAVYPFGFFSNAGVTVGPYVLLFCLVGINLAFSEGTLASWGRVAVGAGFVGYACTIKPWALVPAAVLVGCALASRERRQQATAAIMGALAGIVIPCIVFFAAAPGRFWDDVVLAELPGHGTSSASAKLATLFGLGAPSGFAKPGSLGVTLAVVVVAGILLTCAIGWSSSSPIDWMIGLSAAGLVAGACVPGNMEIQYGELAVGFVAIGVSMAVVRMVALLASSWSGQASDMRATLASAVALLMCGSGFVVAAVATPALSDYAARYANSHAVFPGPLLGPNLTADECVLSNDPMLLVMANRFLEGSDGCPVVVDPGGVEVVAGESPSSVPAATQWVGWMSSARAVALSEPRAGFPRHGVADRYLHANFGPIARGASFTLYLRDYAVRSGGAAG